MTHFRVTGIFLLVLLGGCNPQERGFALPIGNAEEGKATFVRLGCNHCHSVADEVQKDANGHAEIHFRIGGTTTRVRTYGDLVTSIINPNHRISGYIKQAEHLDEAGNSRMPSMNEQMTVQNLVDLTTYLESSYDVVRPQNYNMYYP